MLLVRVRVPVAPPDIVVRVQPAQVLGMVPAHQPQESGQGHHLSSGSKEDGSGRHLGTIPRFGLSEGAEGTQGTRSRRPMGTLDRRGGPEDR